jgi:hypothetical protein
MDGEAWLASEKRLVEQGTWTPPATVAANAKAPLTFGEYAGHGWPTTLKPRSRAHYATLLDRLILPTFADVPVRAVTPHIVRHGHRTRGGRPNAASARVRLFAPSSVKPSYVGEIPMNPAT